MMIRLSTGNSRMEKKWNLAEMELSDFRERISTTRRTSETVEQYRKMSKAQQDSTRMWVALFSAPSRAVGAKRTQF